MYQFNPTLRQYLAAILITSMVLVGSLAHPSVSFADEEGGGGEPAAETPAPEQAPEQAPEPAGDDGDSGDSSQESGDEGGATEEGEAGEDGGNPDEGESGDDGEDGPQEETPEGDGEEGTEGEEGEDGETEGLAIVETGDAESGAEVNNEVNTNTTNTEGEGSSEEESEESTEESGDEESTEGEGSEGSEESSTETTETSEEGGSQGSSSSSGESTYELTHDENGNAHSTSTESHSSSTTTPDGTVTETYESETVMTPVEQTGGNTDIDNENEGELGNNVAVGAGTGENEAAGSDGAAIITGDSLATANIVNVLNTNIVNSNGTLHFLNEVFGGTMDFTSLFDVFSFDGGSATCELFGCDHSGVTYNVTSSSTAEITNNVVVRSSTGENEASSSGGYAGIITGDAYAGANITNVANTNIIDSQYLLIGLNNFGDLDGDVILPGASFFSDLFGSNNGVGTGGISVDNDNDAGIGNNIGVGADTGDNTAETDDGIAIIDTGDATSGSNVTNQVNSNYFGGNTVYMMFRVFGDWTGEVFGLPEGITWAQTPEGIVVYSEEAGLPDGATLPFGNAETTIENTNDATIENNVSVLALTGDNHVDGATGAGIVTGDAYAGANVINIANTNVVGQNWIFAMFNILGDWKGNLNFGMPDLWVGAQATAAGNNVTTGTPVDYLFTISNLGNSQASNTVLEILFDTAFLRSLGGYEINELGTGIRINVGDIAAGETIDVPLPASIQDNLPYGSISIPVTANVYSDEPDADELDNSDNVTLVASNNLPSSGGMQVTLTPDSDLQITKIASRASMHAPGAVDYEITIVNNGGPAFHAELFDTITGPNGEIINQETWWLNEIFAGEEISVSYTVQFATSTPPGMYQNSAQVKAITRHPSINPFYGTFGHSDRVSAALEILEPVEEPVEEEITPVVAAIQCAEYLTSYLGSHTQNNESEVEKLQEFLKYYGGYDLDVTGSYDNATFEAVADFQELHSDEILKPWGLSQSTGYVYYTTKKRINELYCADGTLFPLSDDQQGEIDTYSEYLEAAEEAGRPRPDTSTVGLNTEEGEAVNEVIPVELAGPVIPDLPHLRPVAEILTASALQAVTQPEEQPTTQKDLDDRQGRTRLFNDVQSLFQFDKFIRAFTSDEISLR